MKRTPEEIAQADAEIVRMWGKEHTTSEIADALDLTEKCVIERIRKLRNRGVDLPFRGAGGKERVVGRFPSPEERARRTLNTHEIRQSLRAAGVI